MAVAAYVSTQARLKLYEYLSKSVRSLLYCDADSVIFIEKDNDPPNVKTRDYMGDVTHDLEVYGSWSFVEEFLSSGPKTYAFSVF